MSRVTDEATVQLLRPESVAKVLSVSRSTVLRMIADGVLPAVCLRRGKRKAVYRVRQEILDRWILSKERQGVKGRENANAPMIAEPEAGVIKPANGHALDM